MIEHISGIPDPEEAVKAELAELHLEDVLGPVVDVLQEPALSKERYHLHRHQALDGKEGLALYSAHRNAYMPGTENVIVVAGGDWLPERKEDDPLLWLDIVMSEVVMKGLLGQVEKVHLPSSPPTALVISKQSLEHERPGQHVWYVEREMEQQTRRSESLTAWEFLPLRDRRPDPTNDFTES